MSSYFEWKSGIQNRNYYVLHELQKNERIGKIVSVDFLPYTWRKAAKEYWKGVVRGTKTGNIVYGDTTSSCFQINSKIYVYSTIDSIIAERTVRKELGRIKKVLNLNNIIFWSYNPMFVKFMGQIKDQLIVFDAVDNWIEHPNFCDYKPRLMRNYRYLAENADLIFTVAEELKIFFQELKRKKDTHWIPNGVDLGHYQRPELKSRKNKLNKIKKPIIGYIGTIQNRFDIDMVKYLAEKNQDKSIVLIGPIWKPVEKEVKNKLGKFKNVHFLGRVPFQEAPAYIHKFDVGIIPHKIDEFIKYTNPMKMFEYLACGKPIVSTPGAGVDMLSDLVYLARTADEFNNKVEKALREDNENLKQQRLDLVRRHSWGKRVEKMKEIMFEKLS